MNKPTTAECVAIIDLMLEQMKDANIEKGSEAERTLQTIRSIRAKLLAAEEMAKALHPFTMYQHVGFSLGNEQFAHANKALTAWRNAGGQ